ncbi:MAG TPA: hypothetical protein VM580_17995 [Labilithrix sp.]|nr:hypothetical protein [Labilithrix sp.]
MPIIIGMPPHIIIMGAPIAIMAFIASQRSFMRGIIDESIGIIFIIMPSFVISQVILHIIGIMPAPIIGIIMPPIIGMLFMGMGMGMGIIIGIMPPIGDIPPPIIGMLFIGIPIIEPLIIGMAFMDSSSVIDTTEFFGSFDPNVEPFGLRAFTIGTLTFAIAKYKTEDPCLRRFICRSGGPSNLC